MDNMFSLRLYWWTREGLFPIPSFLREIPPLDPVTCSGGAEPVAVRVLKMMVKEGLRLPASSDVFVTTGETRAAIPDDVSLIELASGKYGKVSITEPLQILVGGNWTVGTDEKRSHSFHALRREITETGFLPPLPLVDQVGTFTAYPTFASKTEDWTAALQRLMAARSHATADTTRKERVSIPHRSTNFYNHEHADSPPPYEAYPAYHLSEPFPKKAIRPRLWCRFFDRLSTFFCS